MWNYHFSDVPIILFDFGSFVLKTDYDHFPEQICLHLYYVMKTPCPFYIKKKRWSRDGGENKELTTMTYVGRIIFFNTKKVTYFWKLHRGHHLL